MPGEAVELEDFDGLETFPPHPDLATHPSSPSATAVMVAAQPASQHSPAQELLNPLLSQPTPPVVAAMVEALPLQAWPRVAQSSSKPVVPYQTPLSEHRTSPQYSISIPVSSPSKSKNRVWNE